MLCLSTEHVLFQGEDHKVGTPMVRVLSGGQELVHSEGTGKSPDGVGQETMVIEVLWAKLVFSTSKSSAEEFFMAGALSWILAGYKDPHVGLSG